MNNDEINDTLVQWHLKRFREDEVALKEAAESLVTDEPLVELRPIEHSSRWAFFDTRTNNVAAFTHAGYFAWGADPFSGNFVPKGKPVPSSVFESRAQSVISHMCEYAYTFDTSADDTFYSLSEVLEDSAKATPGFSAAIAGKSRRAWQDYSSSNRDRFTLASKMFIKKTPFNAADENRLEYQPHQWVLDAIKEQKDKGFIINPERPSVYELDESILMDLAKCKPSTYVKGKWGPDFIPIDLVRVGKLPEHLVSPSDGVSKTKLIDDSFTKLCGGTTVNILEGSSKLGKRQERSGDEEAEYIQPRAKYQARSSDSSDGDYTMVDSNDSDAHSPKPSRKSQIKRPRRNAGK